MTCYHMQEIVSIAEFAHQYGSGETSRFNSFSLVDPQLLTPRRPFTNYLTDHSQMNEVPELLDPVLTAASRHLVGFKFECGLELFKRAC